VQKAVSHSKLALFSSFGKNPGSTILFLFNSSKKFRNEEINSDEKAFPSFASISLLFSFSSSFASSSSSISLSYHPFFNELNSSSLAVK